MSIYSDIARKIQNRRDEMAVRRVLPQFVSGARVIQVGAFSPGGPGEYASFLMILEWPKRDTDELSLHTVCFRDDIEGYDVNEVDPRFAPEWYAVNGSYGLTLREYQQRLVTDAAEKLDLPTDRRH